MDSAAATSKREEAKLSNHKKTAEELISHLQVFPNDANPAGNMFGGRVMEIMDTLGGMTASRYSNTVNAVTASVETLTFRLPVHVGDVLKTVSRVVYTGHTSMVVKVNVYCHDKGLGSGELCTSAHYVFVAMDAERKPTPVPALDVTTDTDKKAWEIGKAVREQSLRIKSLE
jgi:acyl-CoA hydrolase